MPAYVSWYGLLSKQIGGKLVSDPMARLSFALLLIFSLPVGSHHQFTDPGFSPIWRGILTALTLSVALPSLITAFTIGLSSNMPGACAAAEASSAGSPHCRGAIRASPRRCSPCSPSSSAAPAAS